MGLFSKKAPDSKARIEELKKKIQAEQQAFAASAAPVPAPAPTPPQPSAPPAPVPQPAPAAQNWQPAPPQQASAPIYYEQPAPAPRQHHAMAKIPEDLFEEEEESTIMEEIKTGIILDLGDGMSLNLPIRSRMRLDEFLRIADRVRELQRAQTNHPGQY